MSQNTNEKSQPMDVYFIRHGKTSDNERGVISGARRDPEILQAGIEGATNANKIYKTLEKNGVLNSKTPIYVTDRKRTKKTAELFTGRTAKTFIIDDDFIERNLGKYDGVMTERLQQKECKNIGFVFPEEETDAAHTARVNKALDKAISDNKGKSIVIVSHGGSSRRLMERFGFPKGIDVENSQPYHARSVDGGKTWAVDKLIINEQGKIAHQIVDKNAVKKVTSVGNTDLTLEEILRKDLGKVALNNLSPSITDISLSDNKLTNTITRSNDHKYLLTVELGKTTASNEQAVQVRKALGELLIGKLHDKEKATHIKGKTITVELNESQADILKEFAKLKNIKISVPQKSR